MTNHSEGGTPSDLVKRIRAYSYALADDVERLERTLAAALSALAGAVTHEDLDAAVFQANMDRQRAKRAEAALAEKEREGMVMVPREQIERWRADLPVFGLLDTPFRYQLDALLAAPSAGGEGER
jgi:hypothetical protein